MDAGEAVREIYLEPGDFCFGEGRLRIATLLGSCVSIVLWHPVLIHGGMCHYMLPSRGKSRQGGGLDGKYGDEAMEMFMVELGKRHTSPVQYQVNVYGGGNMFGSVVSQKGDIGRQNIEMAHQLLDKYGFTKTHDHLGSYGHRKIAFDVWSGEVRLVHVDQRKVAVNGKN